MKQCLATENREFRTQPTDLLELYSLDEICDHYLTFTPLSLALFRFAELQVFPRSLVRPVLDLGCGTGLFARAAVKSPIEIGVDLSRSALHVARGTGCYQRLIASDARQLPVSSDSIGTVLSISVNEHIEHPERLLAEAHRVLRRGGVFVATIVLRELHEQLFFARVLRFIGLDGLARAYLRLHDGVFRHKTMLTQAEWIDLFERTGFELRTCEPVISPYACVVFDLLVPMAFAYRIGAALKLPAVPRPAIWRRVWSRMFQRLLHNQPPLGKGGCLFVEAVKPT